MNHELEIMEADGTLEYLVETHLMPPKDAPCTGYNQKTRLGIGNVAGLWVLLASATAIGLAWSIIWRLCQRHAPTTHALGKLSEKIVALEHRTRAAISFTRTLPADAAGGKEVNGKEVDV